MAKVMGLSSPERKILGQLELNAKSEAPISPTANLRLLTRLASDLKSVSRSEECCENDNIQRGEFTPVASGSKGLKLLPRKQKSLALLCNKFLDLYPLCLKNGVSLEISLDTTANCLGTEKRRIYDIINILESLDMASKAGKNRYLWYGQNNLTSTLIKLKSTAIRLGLREQIQEIQKNNRAFIGENDDKVACNYESSPMVFEESIDDDVYDNDVAIKEDKSLGAMCKKFIMLFLVSMKNGVINQDMAEKILILDVDNQVDNQFVDNRMKPRNKTKVRRLYDIANVLTAIGLIKKVSMEDKAIKKPVFKYIGPEVELAESEIGTPVREIWNSPFGISTPSKRFTPLSCDRHINSLVKSNWKSIQSTPDTTPMIDKRKLRKRKLQFDGDSPFPRTHSLPNLDKNRSAEGLDDSILRVAAMELQKLNSSEECNESTPKSCTKSFPRCNSDSYLRDVYHITTNHNINETASNNKQLNTTFSRVKLPIVNNNQSLVFDNITNSSTIYVENSKNFKLIERPKANKNEETSGLLLKPRKNEIVRLIPIKNGMKFEAGDIKKILISQKVDSSCQKGSNNNPVEPKAPKIINLSKIDASKLIPIDPSDLKISVPIVKQPPQVKLEKVNLVNKKYAMLPLILESELSAGDTFEAIKVGNSFQLVPTKRHKSFDDLNNHGKKCNENLLLKRNNSSGC